MKLLIKIIMSLPLSMIGFLLGPLFITGISILNFDNTLLWVLTMKYVTPLLAAGFSGYLTISFAGIILNDSFKYKKIILLSYLIIDIALLIYFFNGTKFFNIYEISIMQILMVITTLSSGIYCSLFKEEN